MTALNVMIKPASGECNMYCDYCFYCDEMKNRQTKSYGFMSEETLKNVIRRTMLASKGRISYAFQGGEPTLRGIEFFEKVIMYQKQYNTHHIIVQNALQTNGLSLDDTWCKFLKKHEILVGVSVDGLAHIHNSLRHRKDGTKETYDRILNSIATLDQYQVDYNILTVITCQTAAYAKEIYQDYKRHGWNYQQYIECLNPLGGQQPASIYALLPKQLGHFMNLLFDEWYKDWQKGEQPYIRKFENYVGILAGYLPESCEQAGTCQQQLVVEADGSVYPCDFYMLDDYRLGNFNTDRVEQINKRRDEIQFVEKSLQISTRCRTCSYYKLCRGGCRRNRIQEKDTEQYYNYFCEGYQIFFEHSWERLLHIAKSVNQ